MTRAGSTHRPFRFLAREHELERIRRHVEAAEEGRGGLVVVGGPPGIGVTSLAREAATRAAANGLQVASGRCLEGTLGRPFSGLADALESLARTQPPAALQEDLGSDAGPLVRLCPGLSPMVPALAPAVPLDAADERLRLREAVASWLKGMSQRRPLLVVIDDAQHAGPDLEALLAHVAPRLSDARVLFLVCGAVPALAGVANETIGVGPLDEGATAALLDVAAGRPVGADVARLIHDGSVGNPLFALELYRHLLAEKAIPGDAAEALDKADAEAPPPVLPSLAELPGSLVDAVAWRLAHLPGDARTALESVACSPDGATAQLVAATLGASRSRAVQLLEMGVETSLLTADSDRGVYLIDQPAIVNALLSLAPEPALSRLHRRIALAIEDTQRDRLRESAGELAHHYSQSATLDGHERGLNPVLLAAEQARAAYAHRRVVTCLQVALALAPDRDRGLRADLLGRLAVSEASAGLTRDAITTAHSLLETIQVGSAVPDDVYAGAIDTLRVLRGDGLSEAELSSFEGLRGFVLERAALADALVRARLEFLREHWTAIKAGGINTLAWGKLQPEAARALMSSGTESDGAEVMLAQRARTQAETGRTAELARAWRRPPSVLRALRCLVTDLVWRHGLFREGATQAAEYEATARRYGAHRDKVAALILKARASCALGDFAAADGALAEAIDATAPLDNPAEFADPLRLGRLALSHYRDDAWPELLGTPSAGAAQSRARASIRPAGLLFAAQRALAEVRLGQEAEARASIAALLDACAHQPPLTLYRDAALATTLTAAWELGGAEHAATGRSLIDLAVEAGAGAQVESTPPLARARMLGLAGDVAGAQEAFDSERPELDRAGLRPLRAILDHDEAIAIAAAGRQGYVEAMRLLESAATQFEQLGMYGWLKRTQDLMAVGLETASSPGGRLAFTYPRGLSRREADLVRLVASGASTEQAASTLVIEPAAAERLLSSAMLKLDAERLDELPRLARRYGLGA